MAKKLIDLIEDGPYFMVTLSYGNKICLPIKEATELLGLLDKGITAEYDYSKSLHKYSINNEAVEITYTHGSKIREDILEGTITPKEES